jgi:murein DD-endopeptidase MepM/ murein hydrolase activator NlpD
MQRSLRGLALAAPLLLAGNAGAIDAEDLVGSWHVLAHYKDSASEHPDRERWVDHVWKFEWEGKKLKWTDYPIVVFEDETGRFDRLGTNRQSRILRYWEPSPAQLDNIRRGLEVNPRGAKSKTLSPSGKSGWSSSGRASASSMNVISYVETWSIEGIPDAPVFQRADSLSSGMTETLEGVARYSTEGVEEGGRVLYGRYERDGTQEGTFRMMRSGGTQWVKGSGKTQSERFREMAMSQYAASPEFQEDLRATLEESLAKEDVALRAEDLDRLVAQVAALYKQGKSEAEIRELMEKELIAAAVSSFYSFAPKGAVPDDSFRYALPFESAAPRQLTQGNHGSYSHKGSQRYAFDFGMPVGERVVAARAGKVVVVIDGFERGGPVKSLQSKANAVVVLHDDGTFASYGHLAKGVAVKQGEAVAVGQLLGRSGNTGYTSEPHLHFAVWALDQAGEASTVPIRFAGRSAEGFVPVEGSYYGGPGWKAARD